MNGDGPTDNPYGYPQVTGAIGAHRGSFEEGTATITATEDALAVQVGPHDALVPYEQVELLRAHPLPENHSGPKVGAVGGEKLLRLEWITRIGEPLELRFVTENDQALERFMEVAVSLLEEADDRVSDGAGRPLPDDTCPACDSIWGEGLACQSCRYLPGFPLDVHLASPARRLGAHTLELFMLVSIGFIAGFSIAALESDDAFVGAAVLIGVLYLSYFAWYLVAFKDGQTPGKQLLRMHAVDIRQRRIASWGRTLFRELVAKLVIGMLAPFTLGIIYFWLLWDKDNQQLWDKWSGTLIVNDPDGDLLAGNPPGLGRPLQRPLWAARGEKRPAQRTPSDPGRDPLPDGEWLA